MALLVMMPVSAEQEKKAYSNDLEKVKGEDFPDDFFVMEGELKAVAHQKNQVLAIPGNPLVEKGMLFGPEDWQQMEVEASVWAEEKGRLAPRFAIGMHGIDGFKLRVLKGRRGFYLQLLQEGKVLKKVKCKWQSGQWAQMKLKLHKDAAGKWQLQGRIWAKKDKEPKDWQISCEVGEPKDIGQPSLWGTPYAGKDIYFDNLKVNKLK